MLEQLAQALEAADAAAVVETMADDVTLRVAVHDQPFEGRPAAAQILGAVLDGVLHDIEVSETIGGDDAAVLMFTAQVTEYPGRGDGLLVVRSDQGGRICDLTVYLRPLAALQALAAEMGRRLGGPSPAGSA
jgi:SnoaL-like domain